MRRGYISCPVELHPAAAPVPLPRVYRRGDTQPQPEASAAAAPDGTVLTVLADGNEIYAYAFLEKSYVTMRLYLPDGVSDEDIDAALDRVNYSVINK